MQMSIQYSQRPEKAHAFGGAIRSGGVPGREYSLWEPLLSVRAADTVGTDRRRAQVYGWAGELKICSFVPDSIISPAYIT